MPKSRLSLSLSLSLSCYYYPVVLCTHVDKLLFLMSCFRKNKIDHSVAEIAKWCQHNNSIFTWLPGHASFCSHTTLFRSLARCQVFRIFLGVIPGHVNTELAGNSYGLRRQMAHTAAWLFQCSAASNCYMYKITWRSVCMGYFVF